MYARLTLGPEHHGELPEILLKLLAAWHIKWLRLTDGALGCGISGSGPSMVAFSESNEAADAIGAAMGQAFAAANITHQIYVSRINTAGPVVLA